MAVKPVSAFGCYQPTHTPIKNDIFVIAQVSEGFDALLSAHA